MLLPPKLEDLRPGYQLVAGMGKSTVVADFDFETYSEAGFRWVESEQKWKAPLYTKTKGLPLVGMAVYAEHPTTEVLSLAYDLKDGYGKRLWRPGERLPVALFAWLNHGGIIEAWNVGFEYWIWTKVCVPKYGFPPLPINQLRCAAAKARAFALPGSLDPTGKVLDIKNKKHADGKRLLNKFSMPRNPTKKDPSKRNLLENHPIDAQKLYDYNLQDIAAEAELSSLIPDLIPSELEFWQIDQRINRRGIQVDRKTILNCISILQQAYKKYNEELRILTNGYVESASKVQKFRAWLMECGVSAPSLDAEDVDALLKLSLHPTVRRSLEIRKIIGSAAVKKVYAMFNMMTTLERIHDLFIYHSARTGRAAGSGVQPQNLPNSGAEVRRCTSCNRYSSNNGNCPWCGNGIGGTAVIEWNSESVTDAIAVINTGNLQCLEYYFGNAVETISGCLRGLFISAPGHDLICSDFSAIEAVVLAELAGEAWQQEVFRTHGMIYETTASKITGVPLEEFIKHVEITGKHHVDRKIGKTASLASGYQGWIGAWKAFGADEFLSEEQIKQAILAWRRANKQIVNFWGGQMKDWYPNMYGLEGAAVYAVMYPGVECPHRGITYVCRQGVLYCRLLSGRYLTYHNPKLTPSMRKQDTLTLSFESWNTNAKYGKPGWIRMETYGGKLTENVVQATARDILAYAIVNLEKAGYPVVLHVHDEIVCEVPENQGSIREFEEIMSTMPEWATGWPVKAKGGWRAKRYAK